MSHGAFEEIACCYEQCGEVVVAHASVVARWRRTREAWHCPAVAKERGDKPSRVYAYRLSPALWNTDPVQQSLELEARRAS